MNATLGEILKQREPNLVLLEIWEKLEKDLQRRGRERNIVVHGNWLLSDAHPNDLILEGRDGTYKLYEINDLDQILDRIVDVWQRCYLLMRAILDAKKSGLAF